jgi:hypothetical protein
LILGWKDEHTVQLMGLIVSLITLGLIPYLISKNTKQHNNAVGIRDEHGEILKKLSINQDVVREDIFSIKGDVVSLKELRILDKEILYEIKDKLNNHKH